MREKGTSHEPLRIAFLAWTLHGTVLYFNSLAEANADQIEKFYRAYGEIRLKDGTTIRSINMDNPERLQGMRLDQVFIADDSRMLKYRELMETRKPFLDYICRGSSVPEEFRYQHVNLDSPF